MMSDDGEGPSFLPSSSGKSYRRRLEGAVLQGMGVLLLPAQHPSEPGKNLQEMLPLSCDED